MDYRGTWDRCGRWQPVGGKRERPSNETLYHDYWEILRPAGHGIIGSQVILADTYDIPMSEISSITHPVKD